MMDKNSASQLFDDLYKNIDGYAISRIAQQKLDYYYDANIYGEVEFENFYKILSITKPKVNEVFYDLGSGTGKAVVIASLCFPFSRSIGVEYLKELYETSAEVLKKMQRPNIQFFQNDFNTYDFSDGDVIYMNSYYFYYEMYDPAFMRKIQSIKDGTRLIFVQTPIIAPFLKKVHEASYEFSWGDAPVYIMVKESVE